jgi:hypothetical protein
VQDEEVEWLERVLRDPEIVAWLERDDEREEERPDSGRPA